jgi:hypothetical protein
MRLLLVASMISLLAVADISGRSFLVKYEKNNDQVKTKRIFKSIVVTNTLLKRIMKILK